MLYATYELRRALGDRVCDVIELNAKALAGVSGPLRASRTVRASRAAAEVAGALRLTHVRPSFRVDSVTIGGREVAVTEEIVTGTPFGSLVRFAKETDAVTGVESGVKQPRILVVPGLAGHFATLVRGTISTLLQDHEVYVADWHNARDVPISEGRFGLDEYVEHLIAFLRAIGPGTHLMAVCQPVVACIAAASIMAEDDDPAQPASLILLAGPVDARVNPGKVNKFATRQPLTVLERTVVHTVPRAYAGAGRKVYPGFLQIAGFMGMDPRRHMSAFSGLFRDVNRGDVVQTARTKEFYDEYFAVLDVTAEFYLDTVRAVFQDHDLARGQFYWRGRHVQPGLITSALLTIEGGNDEIVRPGQTEAAHGLCTGIPASSRQHHLQAGVGHYGVFSGSRFDNEIYPEIRSFVAAAERPLAVAL